MLNKTVRNALFVLAICVVAVVVLQHSGDGLEGLAGKAPDASEERRSGSATLIDERRQSGRTARTESAGYGGGMLAIPVSSDGHYYVDVMIGSTIVNFMVDTGASMVALSREDADQIGLDLNDDDYYAQVHTANGLARVAPITIESMRVEGNWVYDVEAVVIDANTPVSLLGMSYLRRLTNFEFGHGALTFYWN